MTSPLKTTITDSTHSSPNAPATPSAAARWSRAVAVTAVLALAILCLIWELWAAPLHPGGSWMLIKALPLLWPLPGLLRYRMFTYRWVALFIWLYFIEGAVRAYSDHGLSSTLAVAEAMLVIVIFAACASHVQLRQRQAQRATATTNYT